MNGIKTKIFTRNTFTLENFRKIFFLIIPLLVSAYVFQHNNGKSAGIPLILIGVYAALVFNYKSRTLKHYFALGLNILIRFIAFIIGILFIIMGKDAGMHNIIIGTIFTILSFFAGIRMSYSLTGILLINVLTYFFLDENYTYFAIGFLIFILIEFLCGKEFKLLTPFSQKAFAIDYSKLNFPRSIMVTTLTTVVIVVTMVFVSLLLPFSASYARQQSIHQNKIKRQQIIQQQNQEFIEKLINEYTKK